MIIKFSNKVRFIKIKADDCGDLDKPFVAIDNGKQLEYYEVVIDDNCSSN